jgi:hypothetical protein
MDRRNALGWFLVVGGVAEALSSIWGAFSVYVIRSTLPFTDWDSIGVIGRITALITVSVLALWIGFRLVRRSKDA